MRLLVIVLLFSWCSFTAYSQPCKEEKLKDKKKRLILEGFIVQSELDKLLPKEKGIVSLGQSTDSLGRQIWSLSPLIQYSYKAVKELPYRYYNIEGRIVLIWDEATRTQLIDSVQRQQRIACLEKLIGDKVTPAPPPFEEYWDWETVMDSTHQGPVARPLFDSAGNLVKKRVLIRRQTLVADASWPGTYTYIFEKDGSVRRVPR